MDPHAERAAILPQLKARRFPPTFWPDITAIHPSSPYTLEVRP